MPECPHYPSGHEQASHKHGEAVQAVAKLVACAFALRNAKHG